MRASFPETCSIEFGDAFMAISIASWNFNRDMQYDPRWAYLPISPMHILLTQHLALMSKEAMLSCDGISSMFQCVSLSLDDNENNLGFSSSFANAILPTLPVIPQHSQSVVGHVAESIAEFAIWDSLTFDPLVQEAADIVASTDISSIPPSIDASTSTQNAEDVDSARLPTIDVTDDGASGHLPHNIVTNRKRKRKASISHVRGTLTSHKKKGVLMNDLGNQR